MRWDIAFSFGPVQGFVAQSRRTRDLWGSSYLLSYLSTRAMCGAADYGEIVRPGVNDDRLYQWVSGHRADRPPRIGSVPNHFVVRAEAEPGHVAAAATAAFQAAWQRVHRAVFDRFVHPVLDAGDSTEEIWRRQVDSFWEIAWVAAPEGELGDLLARRKHWRTHWLPDEPGDKCTVMPDFQELSGHVRAASRASARAQDTFWSRVRADVGALELRVDERLCALAMVKRFFAKIGDSTIGGRLDVDRWPSTLYIGAVPWLHKVDEAAVDAADEYAQALRAAAPAGVVRRHVPVEELRDAKPADFVKLDANYYHRAFVTDPRLSPLDDEKSRPRLKELLESVYRAAGGRPPVYYALLLADGDQLGRLVGELRPEQVSAALSTFGSEVESIVGDHHGITVYAGGDDVLAMLPVSGALACADRLATAYSAAFAPHRTTLSAAVLFAHVRMPVGGVLHEAHDLLDGVAKQTNRRDSVVGAVLKPGGPHCQWVTSWTRRYPDGRAASAVAQINDLAAAMTGEDDAGRGFSASLLHHTRDTLELLCDLRRWKPGKTGDVPDGLDLRAYLRAEIVDSWDNRRDDDRTQIEALTTLVVDLLASSYGRRDDGTPYEVDTTLARVDALLLARFLAGGGQEEDHG